MSREFSVSARARARPSRFLNAGEARLTASLGRARHESGSHQSVRAGRGAPGFRPDPDRDREPGKNPVVVVRRDQEAGDDQLPHVQARARRPVLRAHLRADQGLRVLVRQVQAHEVQGRHLREVRRRSDAVARAPRAHGPYLAGRAGRAYLVPEVAAEPHRPAARHDAEGPRARPLFRILHRARSRPDAAEGASAPLRGRLSARAGRVRPGQLHRDDRRRGDPRDAEGHEPSEDRRRPQGRDRRVEDAS